MKVFHAWFTGHYLSGSATIVAESPEQARELLIAEMRADSGEHLLERNKSNTAMTITEIDMSKAGVVEFDNGDY